MLSTEAATNSWRRTLIEGEQVVSTVFSVSSAVAHIEIFSGRQNSPSAPERNTDILCRYHAIFGGSCR
jgi:hypothetical protein